MTKKYLISALLLAVTSLVTGCASGQGIPAPFTKPADQVMFERGQAFKAYSSIRVAYAVTKLRMDEACKAKKLDQAWCTGDFARLDEEAHRIDARIMDSLANPVIEVDWKAIYEAVELVVTLASKVL